MAFPRVTINETTPIIRILVDGDVVDVVNRIEVESADSGRVTVTNTGTCLLYTSPSPRDRQKSRMPSSA